MNYRHGFHAGNFADLFKHALLLALLHRLKGDGAPLTVIDTHAGAGLYALDDPAARRSGEAEAGVARLMAEGAPPRALRPLVEAVRRCNDGGRLRLYPGSPWLAVEGLGEGDRYLGCELRPDDHGALRKAITSRRGGPLLDLLRMDGFTAGAHALAGDGARTLLLVDPPFERADDYMRVAELAARRRRREPMLIWTPLKDLETFDGFLSRLEAAGPADIQAAELRLQPLDDPMRLNGCAVVLLDAPDLEREAMEAGGWLAERLGRAGGGVRVQHIRAG